MTDVVVSMFDDGVPDMGTIVDGTGSVYAEKNGRNRIPFM